MFARLLLKPFINYRFSFSYNNSLQKQATLTNINTTHFNLNKQVTFHGIPQPTDQIISELIKLGYEQKSPATVFILSDCSKNLHINIKIDNSLKKSQSNTKNINPEIPDSIQKCHVIPQFIIDPTQEGHDHVFSKATHKLSEGYGLNPILSLPAALSLFANPNSVYIVGISQLFIRRCIADSYSLADIKQVFQNIAKEVKSFQNQNPSDQQTTSMIIYQELTYFFPDVIIGKQALQLLNLLHSVNQDCIIFGRTTIQDCLTELVKGKKTRQQIRQQSRSSKLKSLCVGELTEQALVQKHAILECILQNDIWNQAYIVNKFPYLKQDYLKLQAQEQKRIQQRYQLYLNKYRQKWDSLTK